MFHGESSIVTRYILYKLQNQDSRQDQLQFCTNLAKQLIAGFDSQKRIGRPIDFTCNKFVVSNDVSLAQVGKDMPKMITFRSQLSLYGSTGIQKRTSYICSECSVPLCLKTCFS